ncbi:MAG: hypothetical protein WDA75_11330 [Candidatus Latescibacterota bacterium]|jgi:hypothetical protein
MKIVILVAAVCLAIVLGGQIYYLFTVDDAESRAPAPAGISGRIDCTGLPSGCCADGVRVFVDYPGQPQTDASTPGQVALQVPCDGFFRFDRLEPGRHFLFVEYRATPEAGPVIRELASVKVAAGEHQSLGTVALPR